MNSESEQGYAYVYFHLWKDKKIVPLSAVKDAESRKMVKFDEVDKSAAVWVKWRDYSNVSGSASETDEEEDFYSAHILHVERHLKDLEKWQSERVEYVNEHGDLVKPKIRLKYPNVPHLLRNELRTALTSTKSDCPKSRRDMREKVKKRKREDSETMDICQVLQENSASQHPNKEAEEWKKKYFSTRKTLETVRMEYEAMKKEFTLLASNYSKLSAQNILLLQQLHDKVIAGNVVEKRGSVEKCVARNSGNDLKSNQQLPSPSHQPPQTMPGSPKGSLPVHPIPQNSEENAMEVGRADEEGAEQLPKNIILQELEPEKPIDNEMLVSTDQLQGASDNELPCRHLDVEEEIISKDRPVDILNEKMIQRGSWIHVMDGVWIKGSSFLLLDKVKEGEKYDSKFLRDAAYAVCGEALANYSVTGAPSPAFVGKKAGKTKMPTALLDAITELFKGRLLQEKREVTADVMKKLVTKTIASKSIDMNRPPKPRKAKNKT